MRRRRKSDIIKMKILVFVLLLEYCHTEKEEKQHQKRQIFREEVLPSAGGKIPDSAFISDRLILNRLNKDGFSLPDGILLDHRRQLRHPYPYQEEPETLKAILTDDGRYVSIFGQYFNYHPDVIDTTYIIRSPVNVDSNKLSFLYSHIPTPKVFKPKIVPITFPNSALFGNFPQIIPNRDSNRIIFKPMIETSESVQKSTKYRQKNSNKYTGVSFENLLFVPQVYNSFSGFYDLYNGRQRRKSFI